MTEHRLEHGWLVLTLDQIIEVDDRCTVTTPDG